MGLGLTGIAVLAVPLALAWGWLGWRLGGAFPNPTRTGGPHAKDSP
jgi:hypothetical protein